jgi:hypothetical protein
MSICIYIHARARTHTHTHTNPHTPTHPHTPLHTCAHPHTHIFIYMSGNPLFSLLFVVTVYGLEIGRFATVPKRQKVWIFGRQNFVRETRTARQKKKQKNLGALRLSWTKHIEFLYRSISAFCQWFSHFVAVPYNACQTKSASFSTLKFRQYRCEIPYMQARRKKTHKALRLSGTLLFFFIYLHGQFLGRRLCVRFFKKTLSEFFSNYF